MEWIPIAALVASIIAVIYTFVLSKQVVNPATLTASIDQVQPLAVEVEKAATIVVQAYEQARRKGKVELTPPLDNILLQVRDWLPEWAADAVTNGQIIDAINSAILLASVATAQINAAKAAMPENEHGINGP